MDRGPLPPGRRRHTPQPAELVHLEHLLGGGYPPLSGFLTCADVRSVLEHGRLEDGAAWPVPVTLEAPVGAEPGDEVELCDPEGVPLAVLTVTQRWLGGETPFVAGPVSGLSGFHHGLFRRLRRPASSVAASGAGRARVAVVTRTPLDADARAAVLAQVRSRDAELLILLDIQAPHEARLVRESLDAPLGDGVATVVLELPHCADATREVQLHAQVAAAHGACVLLAPTAVTGAAIPVAVVPELRSGPMSEPRAGVTVMFTGLSGSGKSTIARGVRDELLLRGDRTVSLLDGDEVRRMISAGLTFSAEDRSRNVRRIGWVAAEIARHGGVALCAPIAPFRADRGAVRDMAQATGRFVLVHVATPLDTCERRDRKNLYARARAGEIPDFTGVSAPYEVPGDATVVLDTTDLPLTECVARVVSAVDDTAGVPPQ